MTAKDKPARKPKSKIEPKSKPELAVEQLQQPQEPQQLLAKPLRLLANNSEDFRILSGLLQDSILVPANVRWQKKAKRFTLPLSRFCWELVGQSQKSFFRVASSLVIEGVAIAQQRGFKKEVKAEVVNLLACELLATDDQDVSSNASSNASSNTTTASRVTLRFTFSGGAELCLFAAEADASSLLARLTDVGEMQETQNIPQHRL